MIAASESKLMNKHQKELSNLRSRMQSAIDEFNKQAGMAMEVIIQKYNKSMKKISPKKAGVKEPSQIFGGNSREQEGKITHKEGPPSIPSVGDN